MEYFRQFPQVLYTLVPGQPPVVVIDITTRIKVREYVRNNTSLFYTYQLKESDTPDIVATKYYGDPDRFWLVLAANDMCDPLYDWPLPYEVFQSYVAGKYGSLASAQTTAHHYEKWIARTDSSSGTTTTTVIQIDQTTYNGLPPSNSYVVNLQNGTTVHVSITPNSVSQWDYEWAVNEAKRNIRLIDSQYVAQIESELKALLS